jgi:hypothetical protein
MLRPSPIPIPDRSEDDARLREMSPEQRFLIVDACSRTAASLLEINPSRSVILSRRDELPPSSEALWARLRATARRPFVVRG